MDLQAQQSFVCASVYRFLLHWNIAWRERNVPIDLLIENFTGEFWFRFVEATSCNSLPNRRHVPWFCRAHVRSRPIFLCSLFFDELPSRNFTLYIGGTGIGFRKVWRSLSFWHEVVGNYCAEDLWDRWVFQEWIKWPEMFMFSTHDCPFLKAI